MPFQKTFRILLEEDNDTATVKGNDADSFISLNATDANTSNADDLLLGVDGTAAEGKPSWLSENANSGADYAKRDVIATNSGWVFTAGKSNSGNDNPAAQPEVIECIRRLKDTIDVPTGNQVSIGTSSDKTTFYPTGDTFTGEASSDVGDVVAYVYFNEPVNVTGTPQLQLNQASALGSNFGTIMDYSASLSTESDGIVAFALPAGEDTQTSNVTNNTLGLISSSTISLNSGRIDKLSGSSIILEAGSFDAGKGDPDVAVKLENEFGTLLEEAGPGMAADLDLGLDENAAFTVS